MSQKTARAVHANRGIEQAYRRAMTALIDDMVNSIEYWLTAQYRDAPPALSLDASPIAAMIKAFKKLGDQWSKKFSDAAPRIAESYVTRMFKASDSAFRKSLKDAGWAVKFTMTPEMNDALAGSIAGNVGLIKSIPSEYLTDVEGIVTRCYTNGRDLATMVKELRELHPITTKRATLIARDQSNKANAVVNRTRQIELGITHAIWLHSHGGKVPRADHVAANGKKYEIAKGCLISGEYIQPGEEINCRCTSRPVLS